MLGKVKCFRDCRKCYPKDRTQTFWTKQMLRALEQFLERYEQKISSRAVQTH